MAELPCLLFGSTNNRVFHGKGPSINVNIFTSVQTIHFLGGSENQKNFHTLFGLIFIIFIWIFGTHKMLIMGGEGVSESVWFVHS